MIFIFGFFPLLQFFMSTFGCISIYHLIIVHVYAWHIISFNFGFIIINPIKVNEEREFHWFLIYHIS